MPPVAARLTYWAVYVPIVAALTFNPPFDGCSQRSVPVRGVTTGISNQTGEPPIRWEVNYLENKGGPSWDLYILGLSALQAKAEADEQSHFSIAGIHGMPYAPYNGVGPVPGGSGGGFCPHSETQFVAWHRAYVVLYEQALGSEVQRIAAESYANHTNASAYHEAARVFRQPYWDWVASPRLPPSCVRKNITVNGPHGRLTLRNPLYSYRWQTYPLNQTQFPGSGGWPAETTRDSGGKGNFSPEVVNANLAGAAESLREQVYRTFTYAKTYDQMSSMADPAGVSFEAPHNTIHNAVGGSFANVDLSAFDALFMLHHANLDRLSALWAASRPASSNATQHQTAAYASPGLYATRRGTRITAASALKPFYRPAAAGSRRSFHTGLSVAAVEALGYTYPELVSQAEARARRGGLGGRGRSEVGAGGKRRRVEDIVARINFLYGHGYGGGNGEGGMGGGEEWFLKITANRSALDLPCNIEIHADDTLAGRVVLLGMPRVGLAYAEIPLQRAIRGFGLNTVVSRGAMEKVLRDKLRVEIKKGDGTAIDTRNITGLDLVLIAMDVLPRTNKFEFPRYGNKTVYSKLSLGRMRNDDY